MQEKYPFASPYNFTLNNPISFSDPSGKDIIVENYPYFWETFLKKTFSDKVKFSIAQREGELGYRLNVEMEKGADLSQLNETQRKAYEYIKKMADDHSFQLNVRVSGESFGAVESGNNSYFFNVSPDSYKSGEIYEAVINAVGTDDFGIHGKGKTFIHFLAEQYRSRIEQKNKILTDGPDYIDAHNAALKTGEGIFGYSWSPSVSWEWRGKKQMMEDVDIIDAKGNYVTTVRDIYDFSGKKPKFRSYSYVRKGMQPNTPYTGPALNHTSTPGDIAKYFFTDNPTQPEVEKKSTNDTLKPTEKKKGKNG